MGSTRWEQIASSLASKEAREAFVASRIRIRLPAQIREMRLNRGWTQAELGAKAQMKQSAICRCESMGYDQFTLSTLKTLAAAFDVGLKVEFVPFSELASNASMPDTYGLDVPSYALDLGLKQQAVGFLQMEIPKVFLAPEVWLTTSDIYMIPPHVSFQAEYAEEMPANG
jgi:HTH-type transcriptional regulator/antitoxin HipB